MAEFVDGVVFKVVNTLVPEPLLAPFRRHPAAQAEGARGDYAKPREVVYTPRAVGPSEPKGAGAAVASVAGRTVGGAAADEGALNARSERQDQLARECQEIQRHLRQLVKETEAKRQDTDRLVEKVGHESKEARREVQGLASNVAEVTRDIRKLETALQQLAQEARAEANRRAAAQQRLQEREREKEEEAARARVRAARLAEAPLPRAPGGAGEGGARAEDSTAPEVRARDLGEPYARVSAAEAAAEHPDRAPPARANGPPISAPPEAEQRDLRPAPAAAQEALGRPAEARGATEKYAGAREGAPSVWDKDWAAACVTAGGAPSDRELGWESRAAKAHADEEWPEQRPGSGKEGATPAAKLVPAGREERLDYERNGRPEGLLIKEGRGISAEEHEREIADYGQQVNNILSEFKKYRENVRTGERLSEHVLDSVVKCIRRLSGVSDRVDERDLSDRTYERGSSDRAYERGLSGRAYGHRLSGRANKRGLSAESYHRRHRSRRHPEPTYPGPVTVLSG